MARTVKRTGDVWSALDRRPMRGGLTATGRLETRRRSAIERSFTSAGSAVAESVRNSAENTAHIM